MAFDEARDLDRTTVSERELLSSSVWEEVRKDELRELGRNSRLDDECFEADVVLTSHDGHSIIFAHVSSPTSYSTRNLPSGVQSVTTACSHLLLERLKTSMVSPTCGPGGHVACESLFDCFDGIGNWTVERSPGYPL